MSTSTALKINVKHAALIDSLKGFEIFDLKKKIHHSLDRVRGNNYSNKQTKSFMRVQYDGPKLRTLDSYFYGLSRFEVLHKLRKNRFSKPIDLIDLPNFSNVFVIDNSYSLRAMNPLQKLKGLGIYQKFVGTFKYYRPCLSVIIKHLNN